MTGRRLGLQHIAKIYTQEARVTTQIPPSAASLHAFSTPQSYSSSQATPLWLAQCMSNCSSKAWLAHRLFRPRRTLAGLSLHSWSE